MESAEVYLALKRGGGAVAGDSQAQGHEGEIGLYDWCWGMELADQSPDAKSTDRQAEGKLLDVTKAVDCASVPMMSLLKTGEVCPQAVLTVRQRTEKEVKFRVILTNVRVMTFKLNVQCGDMEVELNEDWSLSYEQVEVKYKSSHGNKGEKSFRLITPPGVEQSEPERLSAADSGLGQADEGERFTRDDIIKIIEEYLKKHPQKNK